MHISMGQELRKCWQLCKPEVFLKGCNYFLCVLCFETKPVLGHGHTELVNGIKGQGLGTCLGLCIHLDVTLRRLDTHFMCEETSRVKSLLPRNIYGWWTSSESQSWEVNPDSHGAGCLFPDFLTEVRKREHGWFLLQGNEEGTVPFCSALL